MSDNPVLVATARHGRAIKTGDPAKIAEAKQGITEAKLRRAVEEAVAAFPPLSEEVKVAVAHLLNSGVQS